MWQIRWCQILQKEQTRFMDKPESHMIAVEVAYALPEKQLLLCLNVAAGTTVDEAIEQSGIRNYFEDLVIEPDGVGIFSQKVSLDQKLKSGDRVEIYRPLIADPKQIRRERARKT